MISGTLPPTVRFDGRDISGGPPSLGHGLARTFQSAATYPDETVAGNVYRGLLSRIGGTVAPAVGPWRQAAGQVAAEVDAILDLTAICGARRPAAWPMDCRSGWASPWRWPRVRACCCWTSPPPD